MRIKKFNESEDRVIEVHCIIMHDSGGFVMEDECKCFYDKMKAANYLIKEINNEYEENFEPFYDDDGNRFFTSIEENEDWEKCLEYMRVNEIDIDIISVPII